MIVGGEAGRAGNPQKVVHRFRVQASIQGGRFRAEKRDGRYRGHGGKMRGPAVVRDQKRGIMEQDHQFTDRFRVARQIDAARLTAEGQNPGRQGAVGVLARHGLEVVGILAFRRVLPGALDFLFVLAGNLILEIYSGSSCY